MLTHRENSLSNLMIFIQILISQSIFVYIGYCSSFSVFSYREIIFFIAQGVFIRAFLFNKFHLGIIFRTTSLKAMLRGYFSTTFLSTILFLSELEFFLNIENLYLAYKYIFIFAGFEILALVIFKYLFYTAMRFIRRNRFNSRNAMIIADHNSLPFIESFIESHDWGYRLTAIYTMDESLKGKCPKVRIVRHTEVVYQFIMNNPVDDIFYCLPIDNKDFDPHRFIDLSETIGINIHLMLPEYYTQMVKGEFIDFIRAFKSFHTVSSRYLSLKLKEMGDFIISGLLLIVLAPLMGLIALIIKLGDGGPVFFKQERLGLNGRRFICLKFRSMVVDAENLRTALLNLNESDGPTFKIENDPRVTRFGKFLRKTSLDELPQFMNVLRNEMSIIGPRPPLLSEVQKYEKSQVRRLSMKPGISCIWQVWGRNQVSFQEWMRMDLEYIDNWSLMLDIKIFFATILVVFKGTGQ